MSLREALADLIGAEVQPHSITLGNKTAVVHFRQLSADEISQVFIRIDGESERGVGLRPMRALVALSACDASGQCITSGDEVDRLSPVVLYALYEAAARTNLLSEATSTEEGGAHG